MSIIIGIAKKNGLLYNEFVLEYLVGNFSLSHFHFLPTDITIDVIC